MNTYSTILLIVNLIKYGARMKKAEIMCDCQVVHQEKVDSAKKSLLRENHLELIVNFYKALYGCTCSA